MDWSFFDSVLSSNITVTGVLLLFIIGLVREWLVPGRRHRRALGMAEDRYQEMREDRDQWRRLALTGTSLAASAVEQAARQ